MDPRLRLTVRSSLEQETVTLLADLEVALTEILAAHPDNHAVRSRLTYLLAMTDRVRELFAPQWSYLGETPPAPPTTESDPRDPTPP